MSFKVNFVHMCAYGCVCYDELFLINLLILGRISHSYVSHTYVAWYFQVNNCRGVTLSSIVI